MIFILSFQAFLFYISGNSEKHIRNSIYTWSYLLLITSCFCFYFYALSEHTDQMEILIGNNEDINYLDKGIYFGIFGIILVIISCVLLCLKARKYWIYYCAFSLCLIILTLGFSGFLYRKAEDVYHKTYKNCPEVMYKTNEKYFKNFDCQKYIKEKELYTLKCKNNYVSEIWEID